MCAIALHNEKENDMGVREYIGARYVPIFADPIEWDDTRSYEPLTIVIYQGNSYTSTQNVPTGIDITNEQYWVNTGNYNAQVEAYRQEVNNAVSNFNDTIDGLGTAANKNFTQTVAPGSTDLITSGGVSSWGNALANEISVKKILVVGDSFTDLTNTNKVWAEFIDDKPQYNVINYAKGGAGFVVSTPNDSSSKTFIQQLNQAVSDGVTDVDIIIAYGGYNDYIGNVGLNMEVPATYAFVNRAKEVYPKARIIIAFGNAPYMGQEFVNSSKPLGWGGVSVSYDIYCDAVRKDLLENVICESPRFVEFWFANNATNYAEDQIHPTQKTQLGIADLMLSILEGSYTGYSINLLYRQGTNDAFNGLVRFENGKIVLRGTLKDINDSTSNYWTALKFTNQCFKYGGNEEAAHQIINILIPAGANLYSGVEIDLNSAELRVWKYQNTKDQISWLSS